jgi:hypothetical protein
MSSFSIQQERLLDLLADRALVGLAQDEEAELAHLLVQFPDGDRIGRELEDAAANVAIANVVGKIEPMPARLLAAVEAQAEHSLPTTVHFAPSFAQAPAEPTRVMAERPLPPQPPMQPAYPAVDPRMQQQHYSQAPSNVVPFAPPKRASSSVPLILGWVAAAACLLLAIGAYVLKSRPQVIVQNPAVPTVSVSAPIVPPHLSPKEERERLLTQAGTARFDWSKTKDPASKEATGDVVWNATAQKGFMRFRGLAKNDPKATQYQLWIFDKTRDDKYPVDGGVFDVDDATGDVIVPIKAKLQVNEIALFAVTVEKPGGVVVSKRERIVVTAKPAG